MSLKYTLQLNIQNIHNSSCICRVHSGRGRSRLSANILSLITISNFPSRSIQHCSCSALRSYNLIRYFTCNFPLPYPNSIHLVSFQFYKLPFLTMYLNNFKCLFLILRVIFFPNVPFLVFIGSSM